MSASPETGGAVLSPDGVYRYLLWRTWGPGPTMTFIMLNPSTADHAVDDPTIRRCIGFAKRDGCDEIVVINLFAYRTSSPKVLARFIADGGDPWGPEQHRTVYFALSGARQGGPLVAAWGASSLVALALPKLPADRMLCLGVTASGAPRHPLYVRADQPLIPWTSPGGGS